MTTVREDDYIHFYGLTEAPFALTPDPHFLFPTEANQKALQGIYSCVRRGEGYAVLTGDIGTGKTLICRALLELFERDKIETALLVNPFISEEELVRALLNDFGVSLSDVAPGEETSGSRAEVQRMMDAFTDFLTERSENGVRCVAIVDESQNLPISALEQLRIMGNLETNKEKLLQIVLVGQNEFLDALKHSRLMQLVQRISNWYRLGPMPRSIVGDYFRGSCKTPIGVVLHRAFDGPTIRAVKLLVTPPPFFLQEKHGTTSSAT
ncbi:MAG: AAA family ATPase, partial [Lentisphaerae bacterium]|nr:AAA family ATPase [Lentisphaerota bacterium]MBT7056871.1 AAA family ATPase [Lentisphaerota bacterium]MBT7848619.1 AAA family ATPase [Lentisphaerota bacterium]